MPVNPHSQRVLAETRKPKAKAGPKNTRRAKAKGKAKAKAKAAKKTIGKAPPKKKAASKKPDTAYNLARKDFFQKLLACMDAVSLPYIFQNLTS